ncbi:hypothetical protein SOVF_099760 [Spinacia oleracea]|nr:hypothetical protein SOVF_099760 [Spinacia oleracea]
MASGNGPGLWWAFNDGDKDMIRTCDVKFGSLGNKIKGILEQFWEKVSLCGLNVDVSTIMWDPFHTIELNCV